MATFLGKVEVTEFTFTETDDNDPSFNFDAPEHVLFEYKDGQIEILDIMSDNDEVFGAASYEQGYGGFLDFIILDLVEEPLSNGYWVLMDITGYYHQGDGWATDDDMDFYCGELRKATDEEVSCHK